VFLKNSVHKLCFEPGTFSTNDKRSNHSTTVPPLKKALGHALLTDLERRNQHFSYIDPWVTSFSTYSTSGGGGSSVSKGAKLQSWGCEFPSRGCGEGLSWYGSLARLSLQTASEASDHRGKDNGGPNQWSQDHSAVVKDRPLPSQE